MNFYGIFGCVVLLVVVPAAACFNEHYVRRRNDMEASDGINQHRLPCDPDPQYPQGFARGVTSAPRSTLPEAGRVA